MAKKKAKTPRGSPPRLTVKIDGPKVGTARLAISDLAEIGRRIQQALKRIGRVLYGDESQRQGRDRADIEELCELFMVDWKPGSAVAELELGAPPAQLSMFGYIGEASVQSLVAGMTAIRDLNLDSPVLPAGFDRGVLQSCHALAKVLDHGINSIDFTAQNGKVGAQCRLDRSFRNRIVQLLSLPIDVSETARTGRLEELNGHVSLTGRLWEPDGTKWVCHFQPEHLDRLPEAWMRTVRVVGKAIIGEGKERILHVSSLVILDAELDESSSPPEATFWQSQSLDDLAELQGVLPVDDLDEISNLWPQDDDADELIGHIVSERSKRRQLAEEVDAP